jgi:uncharacterized damage-inducible protein DinB
MLVRTLCLAAAAVLASFGQEMAEKPLTQEEKDFLIIELMKSRGEFLKSLEGLTVEQFKFKPADDKWSIAEVAEHLAKTEDLVANVMQRQILPMKPNATRRMGREEDLAVIRRVTDRSQKSSAPEPVVPASGLFNDPKMVGPAFNERRNKTIQYVWITSDDLRARITPQNMDGYQMLLMLAAHTTRHTAQIQEVKKDPKFPK